MMLVHFPIALAPFSLVLDFIALRLPDEGYERFALLALASGVATGIAAAFTGSLDYLKISEDHPGWRKATWHGLLNFVWLVGLGVLCILRIEAWPSVSVASPLYFVICGLLVAGMFCSNYLGAELLLTHRIGLKAAATQEPEPGLMEYSPDGEDPSHIVF